MPSKNWKESVKEISGEIDRCRETLSVMNNDDGIRKEVYKTPNTLVEVSIKTKKPKVSDKSKTPRTTKSQTLKKPKAKDEVDVVSRRFLPQTESQRNTIASLGPAITPQNKKFQNRTLQVFLSELRTVLRDNKVNEALELIGDVEYIAMNLTQENQVSTQQQMDSNQDKKSNSKNDKKLEKELKELKKELSNSNKKKNSLMDEINSKDHEIDELKILISRLSDNNEKMVSLLKDKVSVEDDLKALQINNSDLLQTLYNERDQSAKLLKEKDFEIIRLHRIIQDSKATLSHDLEELEHPNRNPPLFHNSFGLSSTVLTDNCSVDNRPPPLIPNKSRETSLSDSAIGPSESIPNLSTKKFSPVSLALHETKVDEEENSEAQQNRIDDKVDHSNMRPERDGAAVNNNNNQSKDLINIAADSIDEKVKNFLDRMRNQARLSVSIPSVRPHRSFNEPSINIDMTTDSENTINLSDRKFQNKSQSALYSSSNDESA